MENVLLMNNLKMIYKIIVGLMAIIGMMSPGIAEEITTNSPPVMPGLPKWEVGVVGMVSRERSPQALAGFFT